MDMNTLARLQLIALSEPGDRELNQLVTERGPLGALQALKDGSAGEDLTQRTSGRLPHIEEVVKRAKSTIESDGITFLTPEMPAWPAWTSDLGPRSPLGLFVLGNADLLNRDAVSFVGARASTSYGERVTTDLIQGIPERYVIASGGAYGIDGAAHRAAMASGHSTVVFTAGGVDRAYPAGHVALFDRVLESGGAIVSELLPGGTPTRWRFLQRNRLIATYGKALVVVEAGMRSGSLNAAENARWSGRRVGAVPGPITSAASAGCHKLIAERARIITSSEDVMSMLQRGGAA